MDTITETKTEVKVKKKTLYLILSCGRPRDAFLSHRGKKIKEVISDYENLGQKKLKEKYFGKAKKSDEWITNGGRVWLGGYGYVIKFSDGSEYMCEAEGGDCTMTSDQSLGGQNFERIFGGQDDRDDIFPKEFEIIGDNL